MCLPNIPGFPQRPKRQGDVSTLSNSLANLPLVVPSLLQSLVVDVANQKAPQKELFPGGWSRDIPETFPTDLEVSQRSLTLSSVGLELKSSIMRFPVGK